jgi:NADH-quinone oxidoreductase subunit J
MVYLTTSIMLSAGRMVVISGNPIHSVLFMVLTFIGGSIMMLLLGAEYLARTLLVVYVGAIAMLFLFVVMMLEIRIPRINE